MNLFNLLSCLPMQLNSAFNAQYQKMNVKGLALNHENVKPGSVFIAIKGSVFDARSKIQTAIEKGAVAILQEAEGAEQKDYTVPCIAVRGLQQWVSQLADCFYGNPSRHLRVIGITGTNGKTSVSHFLSMAISVLNHPCGTLGTVGNGIWPHLTPGERTTLDALAVQKALASFKRQKTDYVAMEVSSHGLEQGRVAAVAFEVAVFTNLSRDHLDYHHSMENYFQSKKKLFEFASLKAAVINQNDAYGRRILADLPGRVKAITYGCEGDFQLVSRQYLSEVHLTEACFYTPYGSLDARLPLIGHFQFENLLAALAALYALGFSKTQMQTALESMAPVSGRMQPVPLAKNQPLVVIDYAHTPEGLKVALQAMRDVVKGQLWVVFGCGGDRDKGKRPLMAEIAESLADKVVVTSDNPRSESLDNIFKDIGAGFKHKQADHLHFIKSRFGAIQFVCQQLTAGDGVLLAGKGHEQTDIQGASCVPIDEKRWVEDIFLTKA